MKKNKIDFTLLRALVDDLENLIVNSLEKDNKDPKKRTMEFLATLEMSQNVIQETCHLVGDLKINLLGDLFSDVKLIGVNSPSLDSRKLN